jgi:hypothetical protein
MLVKILESNKSVESTTETKYNYKYRAGKLFLKTEKTYVLLANKVIDSTTTITEFKYNKRGLLVNKEWLSETISMNKVYSYNNTDSLIRELDIYNNRDTMYLTEYGYFPDGRKVTMHKYLTTNYNNNGRKIEYDTVFMRNEFDYKDELCLAKKQYDINGELSALTEFKYKNSVLHKEIKYNCIDGLKLPENTVIYNYMRSKQYPDQFILNNSNDTIGYVVNEFTKESLVKTISVLNSGSVYIEEHFNNNRIIKQIDYNTDYSIKKYITLYEYNTKGDLIKEQSFSEPII